ncbi:hypothetical protein MRX96_054565 [Rhipicephalus microplus]
MPHAKPNVGRCRAPDKHYVVSVASARGTGRICMTCQRQRETFESLLFSAAKGRLLPPSHNCRQHPRPTSTPGTQPTEASFPAGHPASPARSLALAGTEESCSQRLVR